MIAQPRHRAYSFSSFPLPNWSADYTLAVYPETKPCPHPNAKHVPIMGLHHWIPLCKKVMATPRCLPASCSQQIFDGLDSPGKTFFPVSADHKIGAVALA